MLIRLMLAALMLPLAWGIHHSHLDLRQRVKVKISANQQVSLLPPQYLQLMTFGHDSLLADLLWLQMIQYYGAAYDESLPAEHLYNYFDTITSLDPDFEAAYIFSSFLLSEDRNAFEQADKLLAKGEKNLPESWQIPFRSGFVNYLHLKQTEKAAEAFQRAGSKPGAPDLPLRMAAQLYKQSNQVERCLLGLKLWMTAYEQSPTKELKERAERNIIETKVLCDLLTMRKALETYMQRQAVTPQPSPSPNRPGRRPPPRPAGPKAPATLQDLVNAGLLPEVPRDPYNRPYVYRQQGLKVKVQDLPWATANLTKEDIVNPKPL